MKDVTAELVQSVSQSVLSQGYESPVPIPDFHRELWALCCDPHPYVAIAAPRGHAKSTAITHAYVITTLVMRERKYVLIVSDTEEQSAEFIADIKREFTDNDLGFTFSQPTLAKLNNGKWAAIFGNGYNNDPNGDGSGSGVFIMNLEQYDLWYS